MQNPYNHWGPLANEDLHYRFRIKAFHKGLIFGGEYGGTGLSENVNSFWLDLNSGKISTTTKNPAAIAELVQIAKDTGSADWKRILELRLLHTDMERSHQPAWRKIKVFNKEEEMKNKSISLREWLKDHGFTFEEEE